MNLRALLNAKPSQIKLLCFSLHRLQFSLEFLTDICLNLPCPICSPQILTFPPNCCAWWVVYRVALIPIGFLLEPSPLLLPECYFRTSHYCYLGLNPLFHRSMSFFCLVYSFCFPGAFPQKVL